MTKKLLITAAVAGICGSALAVPNFSSTTPLQTTINNIYVSGTPPNVGTDYVSGDSLWAVGGSGGAINTIVLQLTSPAQQGASFGVYDPVTGNSVQIFSAVANVGAQASLGIQADGSVFINFVDTGVNFAANRFAFYYAYGNSTFYSIDSLNSDGLDHMATYQGDGVDQIQILPHAAGTWSQNEYILAWENASIPGDYNDFAVLVESITPVPDGGSTMILTGIAMLALGAFRAYRKQS